MNKIHFFFLLFLVASMTFISIPSAVHADSQLDVLVKITLNTKEHVKADIDKMSDVTQEVYQQYNKGAEQTELLIKATEDGDTVSARQHFVNAMVAFKKASMATGDVPKESQQMSLPDRAQTIKKYETNIKKLKLISERLRADVNFDQIDQLVALAKKNYAQGNFAQNEKILSQIAADGGKIHEFLYKVSDENKIYRAQHFAKKHAERINDLIIQAKEIGLYKTASELEQSKIQLLQANSTQIIKQQFKITVIFKQKVEQAKEIHQSKFLSFKLVLDSLENKAKKLADDVEVNSAANYFLDKAFKHIENARNDIKDLEYAPPSARDDSKYVDLTIGNKIQSIKDILIKVERLIYISS